MSNEKDIPTKRYTKQPYDVDSDMPVPDPLTRKEIQHQGSRYANAVRLHLGVKTHPNALARITFLQLFALVANAWSDGFSSAQMHADGKWTPPEEAKEEEKPRIIVPGGGL